MARFERDFGLNAGLPSPGGEIAASRLAGSFRAFGEAANRFGGRLSQAEAVAEAGSLRPSTEAPELRSPLTIYGRTYNELVSKGHLAAVSNAVNQRINRFASEFPSDPISFTESVNSVRGEFLNEVSPESRAAAEISFDTMANNHLIDIQARHFEDMRAASILSQTEALDNTKISAMKALQNGDEAAFFDMTTVFQQAVLGSDLTAEGKVQAMIDFKQQANLSLATAEIAELFDKGDFRAANKLLNDVRDGNLKMIFPDTGLSAEDAADYLQVQLQKRVGDYQTGLQMAQQREALAKVGQDRVEKDIYKEGIDLVSEGALNPEWLEENRNRLNNSDYLFFIKRLTTGQDFSEPSAPAYLDLLNDANRVDANDADAIGIVEGTADRAFRSGDITKGQYDEIVEATTDVRFEAADLVINGGLRTDLEFQIPATAQRNATAQAQWVNWKRNNPDATQAEAMAEASLIVRDATFIGDKLERFTLIKPRNAVSPDGKTLDIKATRDETIRRYLDINGLSDLPLHEATQKLLNLNDPNFLQQLELIERWNIIQGRETEEQ